MFRIGKLSAKTASVPEQAGKPDFSAHNGDAGMRDCEDRGLGRRVYAPPGETGAPRWLRPSGLGNVRGPGAGTLVAGGGSRLVDGTEMGRFRVWRTRSPGTRRRRRRAARAEGPVRKSARWTASAVAARVEPSSMAWNTKARSPACDESCVGGEREAGRRAYASRGGGAKIAVTCRRCAACGGGRRPAAKGGTGARRAHAHASPSLENKGGLVRGCSCRPRRVPRTRVWRSRRRFGRGGRGEQLGLG